MKCEPNIASNTTMTIRIENPYPDRCQIELMGLRDEPGNKKVRAWRSNPHVKVREYVVESRFFRVSKWGSRNKPPIATGEIQPTEDGGVVEIEGQGKIILSHNQTITPFPGALWISFCGVKEGLERSDEKFRSLVTEFDKTPIKNNT